MIEDNKKIITVSFVLLGALLVLTVHLLLGLLAGNFGWASRIESNDLLSTGIPVGLGFIVFMALQFNRVTVDFTDGVVNELKKVVWPSRKDTGLMTVVVVITLIISGIVVGLYDAVWAYVINFIVKYGV